MKTSDQFLDYYNRLDNLLNKKGRFESYTPFTQKVRDLSEKLNLVRQFKDELISLAELRNAIVHHPRLGGQAIAEPHEHTVSRIKYIYVVISNPKRVIPTFASNLSGASLHEPIDSILKEVSQRSYSQFPVLENERVVELVNTNTIARWLSSCFDEEGNLMQAPITVKDLLPHIEFPKNYKFISRNLDIYEAYAVFLEHINKQKRNLDVLFISETGVETEKPLGWITIHDIAHHVRQ